MHILVISQCFCAASFRINEVAGSLCDAGVEVPALTGKLNYPESRLFDGYRPWGSDREDYHGTPVFRLPMHREQELGCVPRVELARP